MATDYYAVLELPRSPPPTSEEIQAAYRRLARLVHPDRNPSPDASAQFQAVQKAYECLKDPEARKLYDQFGAAEAEKFEQTLSAVAKTPFGKWMLSDWRWVAGVVGWMLMSYLNRNWLYSPLHWIAPAVAAPFFGSALFLQQILEAAHWRYPKTIAHLSVTAVCALLQAIMPLSWVTGLTRLTSVLFCIGAGVAIKDDRDIPLVLFVASFFSDIYGKVNNSFINRLLGTHALFTYILSALPLWIILSGPRYPRKSYLTPVLLAIANYGILPILAAFVLLVPEWLKSVVVMMLPVYVLNYFFSFPLEWLGMILLRILFEMTDVRLRRVVGRLLALLAVIFAWFYLVPARVSPLLLNILIHTYIIRQSCAFNDQPLPNRRLPSQFRLSTFFYWLLIISFDTFVRTISTDYPRYAAIAAGFTILGNFDIVSPPPEQGAPPADGTAPKARPGPSGRRRRGG